MEKLTKTLSVYALMILTVFAAPSFGFSPYPGTSVSVRVNIAQQQPIYRPMPVPMPMPYPVPVSSCNTCGGGYMGGSHGYSGGFGGYGYGYGYGGGGYGGGGYGGGGYGYGYGYGYRAGGCHARMHSGFACHHQAVRFCGGRRRYRSFSLSLGIGGFRLGIRSRSF